MAVLTCRRDGTPGDVLHAATSVAIGARAGQELSLLVWRECAQPSWN